MPPISLCTSRQLRRRAEQLLGERRLVAAAARRITDSRLTLTAPLQLEARGRELLRGLPSAVGASRRSTATRGSRTTTASSATTSPVRDPSLIAGSEIAGTHLPRFADWPAERMHVAEYPTLYPNVLLGFHADHAFAILLHAAAPDRTREELRIFYVGEGATSPIPIAPAGRRPCRLAHRLRARTCSRSSSMQVGACLAGLRRRRILAGHGRSRPITSTAGLRPNSRRKLLNNSYRASRPCARR